MDARDKRHFVGKLYKYANKMRDQYNCVFNSELQLSIEQTPSKSYIVTFYLDAANSSGVEYYKNYNEPLMARGVGVKSNMGNKTGSILFHLQLLLFGMVGQVGSIFKLDNYTDNPSRAASGIYESFSVNRLAQDTGVAKNEWAGKTLDEKLLMSEGQMLLRYESDLTQDISSKLDDMISERSRRSRGTCKKRRTRKKRRSRRKRRARKKRKTQ